MRNAKKTRNRASTGANRGGQRERRKRGASAREGQAEGARKGRRTRAWRMDGAGRKGGKQGRRGGKDGKRRRGRSRRERSGKGEESKGGRKRRRGGEARTKAERRGRNEGRRNGGASAICYGSGAISAVLVCFYSKHQLHLLHRRTARMKIQKLEENLHALNLPERNASHRREAIIFGGSSCPSHARARCARTCKKNQELTPQAMVLEFR